MSTIEEKVHSFKQEADIARQEIESLEQKYAANLKEVEEYKAGILRLQQEKEYLREQQALQAKNHRRKKQNLEPLDSSGAVAEGNAQPNTQENISERINKIDEEIARLTSKLSSLEQENSFIKNQKIPAAKDKLQQAVNSLRALGDQQVKLGTTYNHDYRILKNEGSSIATKQAQSHMYRGAGMARDQYLTAMQRAQHIEQVVRMYDSIKSGPQTSISGQYSLNINPSHNFSGISTTSIHGTLNNFLDQHRPYNRYDDFFAGMNPLKFARYNQIIGKPAVQESVGVVRQNQNALSRINYL